MSNRMMNNQSLSLLDLILEKDRQKNPSRPGLMGYPPATEEQLYATEEALGFTLPPLLRACYLQVGNGGFGPGQGVIGVLGGLEDNTGNIVDAFLLRKRYYQPIDLAECEKHATASQCHLFSKLNV